MPPPEALLRGNSVLGRRGEDLAVKLLCREGYRIVGRNVRCGLGEIDVVARDGATLCFIEIKTRLSARFGWPEEAVSPWKRMRLVRLANWYTARYRMTEARIRFDVVSILLSPDGSPTRTRLIKSAFEVC